MIDGPCAPLVWKKRSGHQRAEMIAGILRSIISAPRSPPIVPLDTEVILHILRKAVCPGRYAGTKLGRPQQQDPQYLPCHVQRTGAVDLSALER